MYIYKKNNKIKYDLTGKGERDSETVYAFNGVTTVTGTTTLWELNVEGDKTKKIKIKTIVYRQDIEGLALCNLLWTFF